MAKGWKKQYADDLQFCTMCKVTKPLVEFYKSKSRPRGVSNECKVCSRIRNKRRYEANKDACKRRAVEWWRKNPDKREVVYRRNRLKDAYGLSLETWDAMHAAQNGTCKICGEQERSRRLAVDHCHDTGAVRGLLCTRCNTALGLIKDSPQLAEKLAEYLRQAKKKDVAC